MSPFVLLAFATPLLVLAGLWYMRQNKQAARDDSRRAYTLLFPPDLTAEQVTSWLQAISGTLRTGAFGVFGVNTLAFELLATERGISYRLRAPAAHADLIASELRTLLPGTVVTPEETPPTHEWSWVVELGQTSPDRLLNIPKPANLAATLLASVQQLGPGEAVLTQLVVTAAVPKRPPTKAPPATRAKTTRLLGELAVSFAAEDIEEQRKKLSEANFLAALRIASKAKTDTRAEHLVGRITTALASTRSATTRFRPRRRLSGRLRDDLAGARAPLAFPAQLAATELAGLLAWPLGAPHVAGLPAGRTRQLPPSGSVPRAGRVLAFSNFPGSERPLATSATDGLKHLHVIGPTGVGKTTLLANLAAQDISAGYGVVVIESKGDLHRAVLDAVPEHRLDDLVVLDVTDSSRPVGFNVLDQTNPRAVVEEIGGLFEYLYRETRGVYTREVLYFGLSTLTSRAGHTFVDLTALLAPRSPGEQRWRDALIRELKEPELRHFWDRFNALPRPQQERVVQPVLDRIWQLNARPEIRNIIGQTHSSFQMRDVIEQNKILLVNLAGLGQETASLTGTLLINALWQAVRQGRGRQPTFLYVDEFQDFLQLPISPESMLAQARGFGLGMVLAHQHLDQLPREMRAAVMANARSKVVFQTTRDDAYAFSREFGKAVTEEDFMNLGAYEVITRLVTGDGVSPPMTGRTAQPFAGFGLADQAWERATNRYGRPRDEVLAEITQRTTAPEPPAPQRPRVGSQEWTP
ncbi:type IV secretion system DNA-binding domain-containing protein [Streptomyces sp. NPDC020898]|uniref:type IV secretion system DNA-binding domain-containing protein n=1 Tax=Streptomyces sp. NPDC020898 TaxID=3365101 RepID=UPI00378936FD